MYTWIEANLRGRGAGLFCIYLEMTNAKLAFQITSRDAYKHRSAIYTGLGRTLCR